MTDRATSSTETVTPEVRAREQLRRLATLWRTAERFQNGSGTDRVQFGDKAHAEALALENELVARLSGGASDELAAELLADDALIQKAIALYAAENLERGPWVQQSRRVRMHYIRKAKDVSHEPSETLYTAKDVEALLAIRDAAVAAHAAKPVATAWMRDGVMENAFPRRPRSAEEWAKYDADGYWKAKGYSEAPLYSAPPSPGEPRDELVPRDALIKAVDCIREWHNTGVPQKERSKLWAIYWRKSPEMKPIREALSTAHDYAPATELTDYPRNDREQP